MIGRRCSVASCGQAVGGYSTLCEKHKRNLRRHGHAEQKGVTVYELSAFRERVAARRAKNQGNPTWTLLQARWEALTAHAVATLEAAESGAASVSHERAAARLLIELRDAVPAEAVIDTALAMIAFEEQRPSRFRSDKAFTVEMARRVRGLGYVNAGSRWSASEGRMKRAYAEMPPRVMQHMGAALQITFGLAGLKLAELEMRDAAGKQAERAQLNSALEDMT